MFILAYLEKKIEGIYTGDLAAGNREARTADAVICGVPRE